MASPAPARKPAKPAGAARKFQNFADWFSRQVQRFVAVDASVDDRIGLICTPAEERFIRTIIRETIGEREQQEWAVIPFSRFRERFHIGDRELTNIAARLVEIGLIERESLGAGKPNRYRVLYGAFATAPVLEPRTLDREPPDSEDLDSEDLDSEPLDSEPLDSAPPQLATVGRRVALSRRLRWGKFKAPLVEIITRIHGTLPQGEAEITESEGRGIVDIYLKAAAGADAATHPIKKAGNSKPDPRSPDQGSRSPARRLAVVETAAGTPSDPRSPDRGFPGLAARREDLRALLNKRFKRLFPKPVDDALLGRINVALGSAGLDRYAAILDERLRRGGKNIRPGLFVNLAEDAWRAHQEILAEETGDRRQEAGEEAPAAPLFEADPECEPGDGSANPWQRIRADLRGRGRVTVTEYENWFAPTAFSALPLSGPRKGHLVVRVPDAATAEFLRQEYEPIILAAAARLGLDAHVVRFLPPEEE